MYRIVFVLLSACCSSCVSCYSPQKIQSPAIVTMLDENESNKWLQAPSGVRTALATTWSNGGSSLAEKSAKPAQNLAVAPFSDPALFRVSRGGYDRANLQFSWSNSLLLSLQRTKSAFLFVALNGLVTFTCMYLSLIHI